MIVWARKNLALIVACVAATSLILGGIFVLTQLHKPTIMVSGKKFTAEYRITESEKQHGLSGKASYPENMAMVFKFADPGERCFWMKDMKFNIDIIWLDAEGKIVAKEENVSPNTYPKSFCYSNAQYVVEFNSGVIQKSNIHIGDLVLL